LTKWHLESKVIRIMFVVHADRLGWIKYLGVIVQWCGKENGELKAIETDNLAFCDKSRAYLAHWFCNQIH